MIGTDTLEWYCKLRQSKGEYDHMYDGINTNIRGRSTEQVSSKKNDFSGTLGKNASDRASMSQSRDQTPFLNSRLNLPSKNLQNSHKGHTIDVSSTTSVTNNGSIPPNSYTNNKFVFKNLHALK